MDDVETMKKRYEHTNPVGQFTETAGKFACDLLELSELQTKLLRADAHLAWHQSVGVLATVVVSSLCFLACMPIVVLGLANGLASLTKLEPWIAQLLVAATLAAISGVTAATSAIRLSKTSDHFGRSKRELRKNIEWTKNVIRNTSSM